MKMTSFLSSLLLLLLLRLVVIAPRVVVVGASVMGVPFTLFLHNSQTHSRIIVPSQMIMTNQDAEISIGNNNMEGEETAATIQLQPPSSSTSLSNAINNNNINFEDWITDAPTEITKWKSCSIKGTIPNYVDGTLIRNGGGMWSTISNTKNNNNNDNNTNGEMYSHIFDGIAKIHAYRIHPSSSVVTFQARFLNGNWYKEFQNSMKGDDFSLPVGIGTGPTLHVNNGEQQPIRVDWIRTLRATLGSMTKFDNTCVNIWDWTPNTIHQNNVASKEKKKRITALTDAPPRTAIDLHTMDTISSSRMNSIASGCQGYELAITAHPMYAQHYAVPSTSSVDTYNVAVELGWNGPRVNLVKESSEGDRSIVSSFALLDDGKLPYLHSFGLSKNYAMIVIQPIRLSASIHKMVKHGFMRSMEHVDYTRVVVIELNTGQIVLDKKTDEKVYFYHSISQAESTTDNGDLVVSLRLCAYNTPDQITGENHFMRLELCRKGKQWRNKLHKGGMFCDILCNVKDQSVEIKWNHDIQQGFELPTTRYSRTFNGDVPTCTNDKDGQAHPQYVYAFGAYALNSKDYDNWGLFKFDMKKNTIAAYYHENSIYLSEPLFIADPMGVKEDDGVLLSQAYFGRERDTKLLVLDARTMTVMAEVATGHRAPLDFHGVWIPNLPSSSS